MSDQTPNKRPRLESDCDHTTNQVGAVGDQGRWKHDEELLFTDGNVILVTGQVGFCVYKGLLANRSPVLRHILSEDASASDKPREVHLSDTPEDLRELLRVFMPGAESSLFTTTHPTYDTVSACIRLGHKYQVEYVVQQALDYLRRYYPSDFDALEQIDGAPAPKFTFTHAIGVVNLARLTGTHSLLPTALALCCSLKAHQLVEGFRRADGTHEVLSSSDLALCFQVNRALIREHVALVFHVFTTPERAPGCTGGGKRCLEGMRTLLSEHGERVHSFTTPLPYAKWDYVKDIHRTSVCPSCLLLLKKRELDRRRDIWNRLPVLCGVGVPA